MPYELLLNIIVVIIFIIAFISTDTKGKIILSLIMATLFILPFMFPFRIMKGACFAGKAIFSIACYFYIK
jgi:hypothetical protein